MTTIKCWAEYRQADEMPLVADGSLTAFIRELPADAILSHITIDKGSQRDPLPVLVGLRASWEEER